MDPNATLQLIRDLTKKYNEDHDSSHPMRELVDAVTDLDEWLSLPKGGFKPRAWGTEVRQAYPLEIPATDGDES